MASFVFTGDPRAPGHDPKTCVMHGLTFTLNGPPVEAPNDEIAARLRRHSHFTEADAADLDEDAHNEPDDPTKGLKIDKLREMAAELGIDHDGVGKADLREAIRAKLAG